MEYDWRMQVPSENDLKNHKTDNPILAAALYNRGISLKDARSIISDPYPGFTTPIALAKRVQAVQLIHEFLAKENGQIFIFADYDADGITSAAIAVQCLNYFHAMLNPYQDWAAFCYIPEREEGYGISEEWCKKLVSSIEDNPENVLVITVDNGVTRKKAVDILQEHGISVLVTDHHIADYKKNVTPDCVCVNPYLDDRRIGVHLAGCGVIFNILRYYEDCYIGNHSVTDMYAYLVAIGTIADMMDMDYYHGCIISWSIKLINSSQCPAWLREVLNCLNVEHVTAKTIGFSIAPFLNACGQAGNANLALDIILESDTFAREPLLQEATKLYNSVKKITKEERAKAEEEIKRTGADKHSVIIYKVETDFPGIVGKIAHYLSEITNKPAICYRDTGEDIIKGSSRNNNDTIPFYDLLKLAEQRNLIISANGHAHAQGCEFLKNMIPAFLEYMDNMIDVMIRTGKSSLLFKKEIDVDQIITLDDITMKNVRDLECFPFTNTWPEPSLCIMDADIVSVRSSTNNVKNVCYTVHNSKGNAVELWAWNIRPDSYKPDIHTKISLVGTLSRDFRKERQPMFNITDFKLT